MEIIKSEGGVQPTVLRMEGIAASLSSVKLKIAQRSEASETFTIAGLRVVDQVTVLKWCSQLK